MRTIHQTRVREFMQLAGQDLPSRPVVPSVEVRRLRANLILEEAAETIAALGFEICADSTGTPSIVDGSGPDLCEIVDGCADLSVVTIGTLLACGVEDDSVLREVDESNLRKFGLGGHRRADGKWMKPPDWTPPDIAGVLARQSVCDVTEFLNSLGPRQR